MWFLLTQIFLLLLLAAAFGAAATFWWMKRRYEDVTESHEDLLLQADRLKTLPQLATRENLKSGFDELTATVAKLHMPDMAPVQDRLSLLERAVRSISIPEPDLRPLGQQLGVIEAHLRAPDFGLEQLRSRMAGLDEAVAAISSAVARLNNADLQPVEARLAGIETSVGSWKAPDVDLGPVHSGLATLGLAIEELKSRNMLQPLHGHLDGLEARLADISQELESARKTDVEALAARIAELSSAVATLRPLQGMLSDIEHSIGALDRKPVDLQPMHDHFARLESSLAAVRTELESHHRRALEPVERGVAGIQEALQGMPGPDLDPVLTAVHSIDSRDDLAAVENRLTAIEYSLAAVHHMLRSRTEGGLARSETAWQVRPVPAAATGENAGVAVQAKPPRDVDPINPVRRPNDQANLLVEAAFGPPDDLEQINGVGPILRGLLNDTGIYYYWQVAEWTPQEAAWVDSQLMYFKGRIKRDDWVAHARTLAALPTSAKRPAGTAAR